MLQPEEAKHVRIAADRAREALALLRQAAVEAGCASGALESMVLDAAVPVVRLADILEELSRP